jgi:hypothetical protein
VWYLFSDERTGGGCNLAASRDPRLDKLPVYTICLLVAAGVLASFEAAFLKTIVHGNGASPLLGGVRITSAGLDKVFISILVAAILGRTLCPVLLAGRIGAEMEVVGRSSVNNGQQCHHGNRKIQACHLNKYYRWKYISIFKINSRKCVAVNIYDAEDQGGRVVNLHL